MGSIRLVLYLLSIHCTIHVASVGSKFKWHGLIIYKPDIDWRTNIRYNPELDIRKYLFMGNRNYKRDQSRPRTKHALFKIKKISAKCKEIFPLQIGDIHCVECSRFTQLNTVSGSCRGRGAWKRNAHFYYGLNSECRGVWHKITPGLKGECVPSLGKALTFL